MTIETALRGGLGFAAACLLAGSAAWAQGGTSPTVPPSSGADSPDDTATATSDTAPTTVAGRVQKVDGAEDTMEIEGVDRQLKLEPDTRITRNGSPASFSDVQEGEQVRASFDDGFPARVRQVEIMSPATDGAASETDSLPGGFLPRRDSPATTGDGTGAR